MQKLPQYVLITPARNEAKFIELTIASMISQSARPLKWVIVSDGSTDGTDDIVGPYTAKYPWIELVRMPERRERHFAGKVYAFNAGLCAVRDLEFDIVGNLDADVSFGSRHFEFLVGKFAADRHLGVVGAPFTEEADHYDYRFSNIENVWGGCQLFRRKCFEQIGGYVPVKGGGIDHIAVVTARMKGWKTRTYVDSVCVHHRIMGTAQHAGFAARFRLGAKDYSVGNDPVWEIFRMVYQMKQRPLVVGGLLLGTGYFWSMARRAPRPVSKDLIAFTRREQMQRLKTLFASTFRITKRNAHDSSGVTAHSGAGRSDRATGLGE